MRHDRLLPELHEAHLTVDIPAAGIESLFTLVLDHRLFPALKLFWAYQFDWIPHTVVDGIETVVIEFTAIVVVATNPQFIFKVSIGITLASLNDPVRFLIDIASCATIAIAEKTLKVGLCFLIFILFLLC